MNSVRVLIYACQADWYKECTTKEKQLQHKEHACGYLFSSLREPGCYGIIMLRESRKVGNGCSCTVWRALDTRLIGYSSCAHLLF